MPDKKNPFVVTFGKKPIEYIYRPLQTDEIIQMFVTEPITNQVYIVRGPRGTGKTVLMADIANRLEAEEKWTVIRCAPTSDIVASVAEGLERSVRRKRFSVDAEVKVPALGGVHITGKERPAGLTYSIEDSLKAIAKKGGKVLITVDEITDTPQMRDFASNLQIWMARDFPVFFLGTALYERIEELQNAPNLTFLYRAPKIDLDPLDLVSVSNTYRKALDITEDRARQLAKLTKGYPFAFQALGYIYWNARPVDKIDGILPDYDAMLSNSAYTKMWQELSRGDRKLCVAMAKSESGQVKDIREELAEDNSNRFNQQRLRLMNKGLANSPERGQLEFTLPRFGHFVNEAAELYGV